MISVMPAWGGQTIYEGRYMTDIPVNLKVSVILPIRNEADFQYAQGLQPLGSGTYA